MNPTRSLTFAEVVGPDSEGCTFSVGDANYASFALALAHADVDDVIARWRASEPPTIQELAGEILDLLEDVVERSAPGDFFCHFARLDHNDDVVSSLRDDLEVVAAFEVLSRVLIDRALSGSDGLNSFEDGNFTVTATAFALDSAKFKPRTVIASPYASDTPEGVERHLRYARRALRDSGDRGEAPFAPHLLYPQVYSDDVEAERESSIDSGVSWQSAARRLAVYTDLGISRGMVHEIEAATLAGLEIEYRSIGPEPAVASSPARNVKGL